MIETSSCHSQMQAVFTLDFHNSPNIRGKFKFFINSRKNVFLFNLRYSHSSLIDALPTKFRNSCPREKGTGSTAHGVRAVVGAAPAWPDCMEGCLAHTGRNKAALNTVKKRKNLLSQSPQRKTLLKKPLYLFWFMRSSLWRSWWLRDVLTGLTSFWGLISSGLSSSM